MKSRLSAEGSYQGTQSYCTSHASGYATTCGREVVSVEVTHGMSIVVSGLVIGVVPHPAIVAVVTPAAIQIAYSAFPSGHVAIGIHVHVGSVVSHHVSVARSLVVPVALVATAGTLVAIFLVHALVVSAAHLHAAIAKSHFLAGSVVLVVSATLCLCVYTCHAHHGYHHC